MLKLLYFTAPWCSPCKVQWPVTEKVAKNLGVLVEKQEVDRESATSWGIQSVPTLIVLREGQEIYRCVGVRSEDQLTKTLSELR